MGSNFRPIPAATSDAAAQRKWGAGSGDPRRLFGVAWTAVGSGKRSLVLLALLSTLSAFLEVAVLTLVAFVGMALVRGAGTVQLYVPVFGQVDLSMGAAIGLAGSLLGLLLILAVPVSRGAADLSKTVLSELRTRLADAYLSSQWATRSRDPEGHLQALMIDYGGRAEMFVQQVATLTVAISSLVIIAVATVAIAPVSAVVALTGLLAVAALLRPLNKKVRQRADEFAAANKTLASAVSQTARVSQEIAAFRLGKAVSKRLGPQISDVGEKVYRLRAISRVIPRLFQYAVLALVLAVALALSRVGTSELIASGPLILILLRALAYSKQAQTAMQTATGLLPYAQAIEKEIARLSEGRARQGERPVEDFERIEFQGVGFGYPDMPNVLSDVSLVVRAGESIGLAGPSGGGKTTLVQLLLKLQSPSSGRLTIDGVDLDLIADEAWGGLIAYVPQDNQLIAGTAADNIRFFRDGFSAEDVEAAAKAAHVHQELAGLPNGYECLLGPGAMELSGGQRQRLGVARALLGKPKILVLDEPTSALDHRSEVLLKETLEELKDRQTLILVAHRPTTLEVCERILVVEGGKVGPATVPEKSLRPPHLG